MEMGVDELRRWMRRVGLVIAKTFYGELGGHDEAAADPEADLLRRIGRRLIVTLHTTVAATFI